MRLSRAFFAAVLAAAPAAASAADLSGIWVVKSDFGPSLRYTLLCVLSADGPTVSGPCAAATGQISRARGGYARDDRLRLSYETDYNGSGLVLDYQGAVQPDGSVKGVVMHQLGSGVFQGSRLADTAAEQAWALDVAFSDTIKYQVLCGVTAGGGRCAVTDGVILQAKGAWDGAQLTLAYDTTYQGAPAHVVYTGTRQADGSLRGSIASGGAVGAFTAVRQ